MAKYSVTNTGWQPIEQDGRIYPKGQAVEVELTDDEAHNLTAYSRLRAVRVGEVELVTKAAKAKPVEPPLEPVADAEAPAAQPEGEAA